MSAIRPLMRQAEELWNARTVAWYTRALARSDYAEAVLGALDPVLTDCRTALDVGAGCGALTLPLAERLARVTALEPAPAMAAGLREAVGSRGLDHVDVVEAAWGDGPVAPHDLVVCAHVGALLRPGSPFLREVSGTARQWVALVQDAGRGPDKFFFRELYPILLGHPWEAACRLDETLETLRMLGIEPTVTFVSYRSDQPFTDLEEACDFWEAYLRVSGEDVRRFLRRFLARRLVREPSGWVAPYPKEAAVIRWPVAKETSE